MASFRFRQSQPIPLQLSAVLPKPRIQGAGAKVTPTRVDIPFEEMKQLAGASVELSYAEGYPEDDSVDEKMIKESVALAAKSDVAVIFVGQPEYAESEMRDLKGIDLPEQQILLIQAIARTTEVYCGDQ